MTLIICEKASQAKAIQKAVGSKYGTVLPAQGHILTLKEPDDVRADWAGDWRAELLWPGQFYEKKPVAATRSKLDAIRNAARGVKRIIIATDCDREGQLIGDEIVEFIGFKGEVLRCIFNAEDPKSLQDAFQSLKPNAQFRGLYMSGQAREQADQTSNLSLTRTATVVLKRPGTRGAIGIGRVKTPVLGIVCKRELEILEFKPQDMFEVDALTKVSAGELVLNCSRLPKSLINEQAREANEEDEEELSEDQAALADQETMVGRIQKKDIAEGLRAAVQGYSGPLKSKSEKKRQGPPKLFDLTALQATASSRFGWSGEKTLEIAQKLYSERTLITYPRGEAKYLPENCIDDIPRMVPALLRLSGYGGLGHLMAAPQARRGLSGHFSNKGLEGMAHYAIIPNINTADNFAATVPALSQDEARLFDVIVRQYLAALAPDFEYRQTTIDMTFAYRGHDWDFRASGRVPLILGWKEILGSKQAADKDEGPDMPAVQPGEIGRVVTATLRTVTTKPPARHTEGSLMKIMQEAWRLVPAGELRQRLKEAKGIGTPATRGDVVKGLHEQGQIMTKGKSLMPTDGGMALYEALMQACPNVVDPARTAMWETLFDSVEKGKVTAEDAVKKILLETNKEIDRIKSTGGNIQITIGKASKPTPKMAELAKRVAERLGVKLPPKCLTDSTVCSAFLNANLPKRDPNAPAGQGGVFPPSEKQIAFAERISKEIGQELPSDARQSGKALSAWIDANKPAGGGAGGGSYGGGAGAPSEKQINFAKKLAEENNVKIPADVLSSMKACSDFISKHMGKSKPKARQA